MTRPNSPSRYPALTFPAQLTLRILRLCNRMQSMAGILTIDTIYDNCPLTQSMILYVQVCSTECKDTVSCKTLERFLLRLDSNLLANTEFLKSVSPAGSISQCSEAAGLGYSWSGNQLAALQFHDPAQVRSAGLSCLYTDPFFLFMNIWISRWRVLHQSSRFSMTYPAFSMRQAECRLAGFSQQILYRLACL